MSEDVLREFLGHQRFVLGSDLRKARQRAETARLESVHAETSLAAIEAEYAAIEAWLTKPNGQSGGEWDEMFPTLPMRLRNTLVARDITVERARAASDRELLKIRGIGPNALRTLRELIGSSS